MPSSTVFISYRREDSAGYAGRLFDRLVHALGRDRVFRDVDTLRPGDDFIAAIREKISASRFLFVLIGPHWLTATDQQGRNRLEDPNDLVRLEIEMALERKISVIPILLPGAAMPDRKQLPESLAPLAQYNAFEIREPHFDQDVAKLISEAKANNRRRLLPSKPIYLVVPGVLGAAALVVAVFWYNPAFLISPERARAQLANMGRAYDPGSFVQSVRDGDQTAVSLFLRAGMKPDVMFGSGSALDWALDEQHPEIAKTLIQGGANPNYALRRVAGTGDKELFHLVLARNPAPEALASALDAAAGGGHIALVKELLDRGVNINGAPDGSAPLATAAYYGRADVMKLLLSRGAAVDTPDHGSGGNHETALQYAIRGAHSVEIVRLLLGAGASVNVQDTSGTTPLMSALDYPELAGLMLANGADVNARTTSKSTALMYAAARHLPGMVKVLIDKGADLNAQDTAGRTPLMYTCGAVDNIDAPETVKVVLDSGANLNLSDHEGWTALMFTAQEDLTGAARLLLAKGADRDKRNKDGHTALKLAIINEQKGMVRLLSGHPQ